MSTLGDLKQKEVSKTVIRLSDNTVNTTQTRYISKECHLDLFRMIFLTNRNMISLCEDPRDNLRDPLVVPHSLDLLVSSL